ncbi:polyhydroxybutyrate depolymerase [Sphingomonas sanguinis]|nr:polyhydroxybutyrate depolymerase [Sphingomonas sp. LC-1]
MAWAQCRPGSLDAIIKGEAAIHLPTTPSMGPRPLVLLLHGSTSNGAEMLRDSALADTADRHDFIVLAPNGGIPAGRGFVWNIPGVPTVTGSLPPKDARDDVAYLARLVDRMIATGCVDRSRVYATGLSGGGRMTSLLGCRIPDRLAAIAPVVGLRAGRPLKGDSSRADPSTCRPPIPLALLAFSGDADTTNPIAGGGAPYWQYTQATALQRWGQMNGCAAPYARNIAANIYEQGYAKCRGGVAVAARVKRGGGHSWSVVDNEAMWTFLSRYTRPTAP